MAAMANNPKGYANPHLLVTPSELAAALGGPDAPLLLDLRPAEAYAAGHLPGAVHLDLFGISLIDTDPAPLRAFLWILEHLLASRGVDRVAARRGLRREVGHAGRPGVLGPRVLRPRAHAPAGRRLRRMAGRRAPDEHRAGRARVHVVDGHAGRRSHRLVSRRAAIASTPADAVILDTRSDGEYRGTTVRAARGGCIPGAVHVEWTTNLRPDGSFKSADELRAMYEAAGVTPDKEVLTYCQGGYRAAHGYLALRLLGYPARAQLRRLVEGMGRPARAAGADHA